MSLSTEHTHLVKLISDWCSKNSDRSKYLEFIDDAESRAGSSPPATGRYIPDLAWMTLDNRFRFIGEAKTRNDINNDHTMGQLEEYLRMLSWQQEGELILAVPSGYESSARALVALVEKKLNLPYSKWCVVSPGQIQR